MDNKVASGLIGLIGILAAFGGSIYLAPEQVDVTYYCPLTEQIAIFDRLSASMKTGYYVVDSEEQAIACRIGSTYSQWILLKQYLVDNDLSIEDVFKKEEPIPTESLFYARGIQGLYICEYKDEAIDRYSKCYKDKVFKVYLGELICPS